MRIQAPMSGLKRTFLEALLLFVTFAFAGVGAAQTTYSLRGFVKYVGNPPEVEKLRIAGDRYCKELYAKGGPLREEIIVNANSTLKNVVVFIKKHPQNLPAPKPRTDTVYLNLSRCLFSPHVVAIQAGQKIEIRNEDGTVHNVNALPRKNARFNRNLPGKGDKVTLSLDKPELPVRLKCDVHPWMHAYAAVFDHPWFAVTGDDGSFEIPDLIPGEYVLEAWHEKFGLKTVEVLVKKDEPSAVEIQYLATNSRSFFGL